jgi:hypothetical protein
MPVPPHMPSRRASSLRRLLVGTSTALALSLPTRPALSQVTATINTGVTVDVALTGAAIQNLEFTRMAPGATKTVATQDAQSCTDGCTPGKWRFQNISTANGNRRANLQFTALPDSLVGPGGAKLGVAYTARACVYSRLTNTSMGCVTQAVTTQGSTLVVPINNVAGAIGDTRPRTARDIYLWLGGTATARPGQRAGNYTGVVTVFYFYN